MKKIFFVQASIAVVALLFAISCKKSTVQPIEKASAFANATEVNPVLVTLSMYNPPASTLFPGESNALLEAVKYTDSISGEYISPQHWLVRGANVLRTGAITTADSLPVWYEVQGIPEDDLGGNIFSYVALHGDEVSANDNILFWGRIQTAAPTGYVTPSLYDFARYGHNDDTVLDSIGNTHSIQNVSHGVVAFDPASVWIRFKQLASDEDTVLGYRVHYAVKNFPVENKLRIFDVTGNFQLDDFSHFMLAAIDSSTKKIVYTTPGILVAHNARVLLVFHPTGTIPVGTYVERVIFHIKHKRTGNVQFWLRDGEQHFAANGMGVATTGLYDDIGNGLGGGHISYAPSKKNAATEVTMEKLGAAYQTKTDWLHK